jgi:FliI/YscN family ATPase
MSRFLDLTRIRKVLAEADTVVLAGRVTRASGIMIEATLPQVAVGTACEIRAAGGRLVPAEVVGFSGARALLMPFGEISGIGEGCPVVPKSTAAEIAVGEALLGRVCDAGLRPLDGGPTPVLPERVPLNAPPPPAMARKRIKDPLVLGIRALDACLTCGEGQRLGIMAGPGVGKSMLLGMLARSASADVIVVGLIGERGREVREFVERDLGPGLARSVVVVATADEPPLVRVRAVMAATAVAEYFRARGKKVLLLVDSLTRVAMAQREIGLAVGEPPTSRGYPPSVFALLPRLVERAGNGTEHQGSITAMYTILVEGDDLAEPVADAARAALDGHVVLSRKLANGGHFPAIDILGSISRVMSDVVGREHKLLAAEAREVLSVYRESADLVEVGAYVAGTNPRLDRALGSVHRLNAFFRQELDQRYTLTDTLAGLGGILTPSPVKAGSDAHA